MKTCLEKFSELIIRKGVNIQKGQELYINCPIECAEFGRTLAKIAFDNGAGDVIVIYNDELLTKIRYENAELKIFESIPQYIVDRSMHHLDNKAAFLSIYASDPDLLKDVDANKITTFTKTKSIALKQWSDAVSSNKVSWCIVSVPTKSWAKKVFPNVNEEIAIDSLWDLIYKSVRADKDNPVEEWNKHINLIKEKCKFLNQTQFYSLQFKNGLGTDITIGLPKNHIWLGGSEKNADGIEFIANIPTEEMFTAPDKRRIDGSVVSTKPFCYNGNIIKDFKLTYENGKLIDFDAKEGKDLLKGLLEMDNESTTFGEVAIVPFNSPISNMDTLFYNTLFDENASCHFALGRAYSNCVENTIDKTDEELSKMGLNTSIIHEDFMIGSPDLEIIGIKENGEKICFFKNGNWID